MSNAAWTSLDPAAEAILQQSRDRRVRALRGREGLVKSASVAAFVAATAALAVFAPPTSMPSLALVAAFVVAYALAQRVEFEVGSGSAVPTQIVLVPMLFALPPALVPLAVAAGFVVGGLPDLLRGRFHAERLGAVILSAWHAVGAAAVFAAAGAPEPTLAALPILGLALLVQFATDFGTTAVREILAVGVPVRTIVGAYRWVFTVDALLTPIGFLAAVAAALWSGAFLLALPLIALLHVFAKERTVRIDRTLELSSAYRGTAFLLGDVIEADDAYTGSHSRDVVSLSLAVAEELGLDARTQRRVELAALLHDVGKIRVPNEIINKTGALDEDEWAVIKQHTIEGQRMLERVGGLLGEVGAIVRSCHERWDGTGYPDRLAGDTIPIEARIVCACDAFNAMTTDRSYRRAMSPADARAELERCAGTHFDPAVVRALLAVS
jgi:putative nucleotidyltransferase with HDIG domain